MGAKDGFGVLLLLLVLLAVVACSPGTTGVTEEELRAGREVYVFEGCGACHGAERRGTARAPALTGLHRHWSPDDLERYLANPQDYPQDKRLAELARRFPAGMAGMPGASEERLRKLAKFLVAS